MIPARILITGGAGFIGSHLAQALLQRGCHVRILDDLSNGKRENCPQGAEFLQGSITDPIAVDQAMQGMHAVFHLAAVASVARCTQDWLGGHQVNQTGTIMVFDAARRQGHLPVVYASTAAVYGQTCTGKRREDSPTQPLSPYGADKLGCEHHAIAARSCFDLPTLGLRFFNVYGPRQDGNSPYSGVISIFQTHLERNLPLPIQGDGEQTRDFIYVADVVTALCRAMEHLAAPQALAHLPPVLNVCTGQVVSINQLAHTMTQAYRLALRTVTVPARAGDVRTSCGDPSLLHATLGVWSFTPLPSGLHTLVTTADRSLV